MRETLKGLPRERPLEARVRVGRPRNRDTVGVEKRWAVTEVVGGGQRPGLRIGVSLVEVEGPTEVARLPRSPRQGGVVA